MSDMFFLEFHNGELNRADMIVRYLAVENYFGLNNFGFDLYKRMQELRKYPGYSVIADKQFRELIESYKAGSYDKESRIMLDKNLTLWDGSHRTALNIFFHVKNISALNVDINHPVNFSLDWFIENNFTRPEIEIISSKIKELYSELNKPFTCIIWSPAFEMAAEIAEDLKYFGEVINLRNYSYNESEYANVVRAVYSIDDIAKWKIEKKIECMNEAASSSSTRNIAVVSLRIKEPDFRIKASSGLPLSRYLEKVKRVIRTKYKSRIKNYFHDICFHVGDNFMQNDFIAHVFEAKINMNSVIDILNHYEYAFVKIDVPYMPEDFPDRVPIGKDADIFCRREDLAECSHKIQEHCMKTFCDYDIRVIESESGTRLRMELYGRLIYQIDISCEIYNMPGFVGEALEHRIYNGRFYVLSPEYEYVLRLHEYSKNNSKVYHLEYIKHHCGDCNSELTDKYYSE